MPVLTVPTRGGRVQYRPHHVRPGLTGGYPCTGAVSTIAYARHVAAQHPVDPAIAVRERQDQPVPPGDLDVAVRRMMGEPPPPPVEHRAIELGIASGRVKVCEYEELSGTPDSLKQKKT